MSFSFGSSTAAVAPSVRLCRRSDPTSDCASDFRMQNIVFAAATSIVPTAIGRTTLYQSE